MMDQDFINYVQIVLDEKGISNAAKRLNISQPALSARTSADGTLPR